MNTDNTHSLPSLCLSKHNRPGASVVHLLAPVIAIGLAFPHVTAASHRMELQIQTEKLITLVEQRLAEESPCFFDDFALPNQSGTFALDHIEFPGGSKLRRAGDIIQLTIPMEIFTKRPACLTDPDCGLTDYEPSSPLSLDLVFDITGEAKEDGNGDLQPFMCVEFSGVELSGEPIPLAGLEGPLESVAISKCNLISVGAVKKLLAGDPTIKKVGLNANTGLSRVALRIEFEDPHELGAPPDPSWFSFINGDILPSAPNTDWSLFIDEEMFREAVVDRFASEIGNDGRVSLVSPPAAFWTGHLEDGGHVDIGLEADVDAETCTIGTDADINVDFSAGPANPNLVHTTGALEINLDPFDLVVNCAATTGPLSIGVLTSVTAILSQVSIESLLLGSSKTLPDECSQTGDETFACNFPTNLPRISLSRWNLPMSPGGSMSMTKFFGHPDGPILGGPFTTSPIPPHFPLSIESTGFHYGVKGGCSTLHLGWGCGVRIEGTGKLCQSIQVLDDPYGVFAVDWQGGHPLGNNYIGYSGQDFDVIFPVPGSDINAYNANPYPCKLYFRTSIGSGTIAIGGPDQGTINPGESAVLLGKAQADCLAEITFIPHRMNPLWKVDPPPFDLQAQILVKDPAIKPASITAELTDVSIVSEAPIGGSTNEGGEIVVSNTPVQLQVTVRTRFNSGGAPHTKRVDSNAQSKPPEEMKFTLKAPISVDLIARNADDGLQGEAVLTKAFSRILDAEPDQLPPGVRSASFFVEIDPDDVAFEGPLEDVSVRDSNSGPATDPVPMDACGDGACGAGSVFGMPLLLVGAWVSRRRPRRRGTSSRSH